MDRLIDKLNKQLTAKEFIEAERKCAEWVMANFYNTGIASVSALFSARKEVPAWNLGKNAYSYRFEYIGATK